MMVSNKFKEFTERSRYPRGFHRLQKIFEAGLTEFRWKTDECEKTEIWEWIRIFVANENFTERSPLNTR